MAAMALITDPDVVILDEPTTALDVTSKSKSCVRLNGWSVSVRSRAST